MLFELRWPVKRKKTQTFTKRDLCKGDIIVLRYDPVGSKFRLVCTGNKLVGDHIDYSFGKFGLDNILEDLTHKEHRPLDIITVIRSGKVVYDRFSECRYPCVHHHHCYNDCPQCLHYRPNNQYRMFLISWDETYAKTGRVSNLQRKQCVIVATSQESAVEQALSQRTAYEKQYSTTTYLNALDLHAQINAFEITIQPKG